MAEEHTQHDFTSILFTSITIYYVGYINISIIKVSEEGTGTKFKTAVTSWREMELERGIKMLE